jgi:hypothetical protein
MWKNCEFQNCFQLTSSPSSHTVVSDSLSPQNITTFYKHYNDRLISPTLLNVRYLFRVKTAFCRLAKINFGCGLL